MADGAKSERPMAPSSSSSSISAIWRQLCPRCRQGSIFAVPLWRGPLTMHERCPVCGLKFDREPGYFLGALYFSYALSIPPGLALALLIWRFSNWSFNAVMFGAFLAYLPLVPFVSRLSRVLWIYMDRHFDPD
jgi:uncharacterized protein (DUF983 family)